MLSLSGLDFITSISGAATSISNVGPGLGSTIGPNGDFSSLPDVSKWILSVGMILGRLELFAILVLFLPSFWKKDASKQVVAYDQVGVKDIELHKETWSNNKEQVEVMAAESLEELNKMKEEVEEKLNSLEVPEITTFIGGSLVLASVFYGIKAGK